jgi:hypothetical protein
MQSILSFAPFVRALVIAAGVAAGGYGLYQIIVIQGMLKNVTGIDLSVPVIQHAGLTPMESGAALLVGGLLAVIGASLWRTSRA